MQVKNVFELLTEEIELSSLDGKWIATQCRLKSSEDIFVKEKALSNIDILIENRTCPSGPQILSRYPARIPFSVCKICISYFQNWKQYIRFPSNPEKIDFSKKGGWTEETTCLYANDFS